MLEGDYSQHGTLQCTKIGLKEFQESIHSSSISHDSKYISFAMGNGCIKIYDMKNMKQCTKTRMGAPYDGLPSTAVKWNPIISDNRYIIGNTSSVGGAFTWLWEGCDFMERRINNQELKNETSCMEFTIDGKNMFTGGSSRKINVYDLETNAIVSILSKGVDNEGKMKHAHANRIFSIKTMSQTTLVSAGWQSPIQIWDLRTGRAERQVEGATPSSDCLEPIPGTVRFFCCSCRPERQIQVFDFVAGREIFEESEKFSAACGKANVNSISFRPETNVLWVATSKPDMILQINAITGELMGKVPSGTQLLSITSSPGMPKRCVASGMKEIVYVIEHQ